MQQHPVPQNIKEFNFKLFGNLTVRQFVTLAIPMALAALVFFSNLAPIVRMPLALVIGLFGFFVAVVPVQGRPFDKWIVAFIRAISTPTQRLWIKEKSVPEFLSVVVTPPVIEERVPEEVASQRRERMIAYLKSLPKDNESPLDVREQIAIKELNLTTDGAGQGRPFAPIVWPSPRIEEDKPTILVGQADLPKRPVMIEPSVNIDNAVEIEREVERLDTQAEAKYEKADIKLKHAEPVVLPHITPAARPYTIPAIEDRIRNMVRPGNVARRPLTHLASETSFADNLISLTDENNRVRLVRGVGRTRVRKLHFAPPANFDLSKLPIRGEKQFEISQELAKRFHFGDESPSVVLPNEASSSVSSVQIEIPAQGTVISKGLPKQVKVSAPKTGAKIKNTEPVKVVQEIKKDGSRFSLSNAKPTETGPNIAQSAQIIPLTSVPNVVSGLVTDMNGTPIESAVLVIRDVNGIPVRALKTNKLGQFLSATPLGNGTYSVEIESEHVKFAPTSVNLSGQILPPLGIRGEALK